MRQEDEKKKEFEEVRVKRMSCDAVKDETRRKEADLIQFPRNRAGELNGLRMNLENHLIYCQEILKKEEEEGQRLVKEREVRCVF